MSKEWGALQILHKIEDKFGGGHPITDELKMDPSYFCHSLVMYNGHELDICNLDYNSRGRL